MNSYITNTELYYECKTRVSKLRFYSEMSVLAEKQILTVLAEKFRIKFQSYLSKFLGSDDIWPRFRYYQVF